MSQGLSREWLINSIKEIESIRDEIPFGIDTDAAKTLEAFKMALAGMDSKPVAILDVQSGRPDGNKFALVYSSAAHKLPDDVYYLHTAPPATVAVPDEDASRELFEAWFAADCSFDKSPSASEDDNYAWKESNRYVWERCRAAMLQGTIATPQGGEAYYFAAPPAPAATAEPEQGDK
ncbi:hypothetical protein [Kosakonia sacchari]|uniref:hypothetical protein n=1 Tax=Kosakonia sacchari TaxID=1158459 RepID=UPI0015857718|nr:hypothetical protein [Kosakonia sacchari]NUL35084.1 hypothetical protein [Kosakonia sacchari]